MARKKPNKGTADATVKPGRSSGLLGTRGIYFGNNPGEAKKLPPQCVDLNYVDPPFTPNRNCKIL